MPLTLDYDNPFHTVSVRKPRSDYMLQPAERSSILRDIGRAGISAASRLANLLDLPGSMVRDTAAWAMGDKSANPFDQLLTPTMSDSRTTGTELLRQASQKMGSTLMDPSRDDPWYKSAARGAAGIGAEILTDPLSWVTPLGLTKAGVQAAKAGTLARGIAPSIRAGQRSLLSFNLPLATRPFGSVGSQTKAAEKLGGWLDTKAEKLIYGSDKTPANWRQKIGSLLNMRGARQYLDASVMGRTTSTGQKIAEKVTAKERNIRQAVLGAGISEALRLRSLGTDQEAIGKELRQIAEGVINTTDAEKQAIVDSWQQAADEILKGNERYGFKGTSELVDDLSKVPVLAKHGINRNLRWLYRQTAKTKDPLFDPVGDAPLGLSKPAQYARNEALKGHAGGTEQVRQIMSLQDPGRDETVWNTIIKANANTSRKHAIKQIRQRLKNTYGSVIDPTYEVTINQGGKSTTKKKDRLRALATLIFDTPEEVRKVGFYYGHPVYDMYRYQYNHRLRQAKAETIFDWIKERAFNPETWSKYKQSPSQFADKSQWTTIGKFLSKSKLTTKFDSNGVAQSGAGRELVDLFNQALPDIMPNKTLAPTRKSIKSIMKMPLPAKEAADLLGLWTTTRLSNEAAGIKAFMKGATSAFKIGVLTHPARYTRDLMSAWWKNFEEGMFSPGSVMAANQIMLGNSTPWINGIQPIRDFAIHQLNKPNPSPADLAEAARALYASHLPGGTIRDEVGGSGITGTLEGFLDLLPGAKQPTTALQSVKGVAKTLYGRDKSGPVLGIPGAPGKELFQIHKLRDIAGDKNTWAPAAAGDIVGNWTDSMSRFPAFLTLLRDGYDPAVAMRKINEAQVVYAPHFYTPFEREWLKVIFPFYSFLSRQLSHTVKSLARHPGGRLAQTLRATQRASADDPTIPEHIRQRMAIPNPFGKSRKGKDTQSYITGLGLMHEDPVSLLGDFADTNWRGLGLELASDVNPLLRAPVEWIYGRSAFQGGEQGGRNLEDLDPPVARMLANIRGEKSTQKIRPVLDSPLLEFIAGASPASRYIGSAKTLFDPRKAAWEKALNLLTGIRLADVSPPQRLAIAREYAQELMRDMGASTFENVYFPEYATQNMSPDELKRSMLLRDYLTELRRQGETLRKGK